jgi:serine/threonine-protein kinase
MSHPNVIKVTDLIDEQDTVAFVMEFVEGETLKEYIDRKRKLTDGVIVSFFSQMLDAVNYVHSKKLVHRDIKPSNFMVTPDGNIKLMDFGIAKNTDETSLEYTQTGTGMQMGTPMYMSPEQITETKNVTIQSDIYSLGVVLWQMVTSKKPYDTKTLSSFQLQTKIVNDPLPTSHTPWDDIIAKATNKQENNRFSDCLSFKNALNDLFEIEQIKTVVNSGEQTVIAPAKIAGKGRLLAEYADQIGVAPYFAQYQAGWIGL